MPLKRIPALFSVVLTVLLTGLPPAPAAAGPTATGGTSASEGATIHVRRGESIQRAVNRAQAGDVVLVHPGVYPQVVQIRTSGVTLRGSGSSEEGTVLVPPRKEINRCFNASVGICVTGRPDLETGGFEFVENVEIVGFRVEGFSAFGIDAVASRRIRIAHNVTVKNGQSGVAAFSSRGGRIVFNTSIGGEAGFQIGDEPEANFRLEGNRAKAARVGFLIRDASVGTLADNLAFDNCIGIRLSNGAASGGVREWIVRRNDVHENNRSCPLADGSSDSGTGLLLEGARDLIVRENLVWGNQPVDDTATAPGGIVMVSSPSAGPAGVHAAGNRILDNTAYRNGPFDLRWDGLGRDNQFVGNDCTRSSPSGLCG